MTQKAHGIDITDETLEEIIKALAYGLDEATVAECNGVTVEEVNAIAAERAQRVTEIRSQLTAAYPGAI